LLVSRNPLQTDVKPFVHIGQSPTNRRETTSAILPPVLYNDLDSRKKPLRDSSLEIVSREACSRSPCSLPQVCRNWRGIRIVVEIVVLRLLKLEAKFDIIWLDL
jgi:hypothetical protein